MKSDSVSCARSVSAMELGDVRGAKARLSAHPRGQRSEEKLRKTSRGAGPKQLKWQLVECLGASQPAEAAS